MKTDKKIYRLIEKLNKESDKESITIKSIISEAKKGKLSLKEINKSIESLNLSGKISVFDFDYVRII